MTIALALKVHDGLVFATDSASTLTWTDKQTGNILANIVYNNANKIVNLHRALPIGLMTWGLGNIGQQSISTLAKELRRRLQGDDPNYPTWALDPGSYTIKGIAERAKEFLHDELLSPQTSISSGSLPELGIIIGGFSANAISAESYVFTSDGINCSGPTAKLEEEAGAAWFAQGEAITRLVLGFSGNTENALVSLGVPQSEAPKYVEALKVAVSTPLINAPMPIQDVIDLAIFLVDTTIKFTRFSPGPDTVGGPIEVVAITRHEGFKWINRKHYYSSDLNPKRSNGE